MHWLYNNYIIALTDRNNIKVINPSMSYRAATRCSKGVVASVSIVGKQLTHLLLAPVVKLYSVFKSYSFAYRERNKLEQLTEQKLEDIGITKYDLPKKLRNIPLGELEQEFDRKIRNRHHYW